MSLSSYTGWCSTPRQKTRIWMATTASGFIDNESERWDWDSGLWGSIPLCVFVYVWALPLCKLASAACRLMWGLNSVLWIALRFFDVNHCSIARYDEWIVTEYLIWTSLAFLTPGRSIACISIKCSHCVQLLLHFCCSLHVAIMSYKQAMHYQAESHSG